MSAVPSAILPSSKQELDDRLFIADGDLVDLSDKLRPVVRDHNGDLRLIQLPDLRKQSFLWAPRFLNAREAPSLDRLVEVERIETLHTCGAPSLFKPSIAEVLAQIPAYLTETAHYFETLSNCARVLEIPGCEVLHITETVLYRQPRSYAGAMGRGTNSASLLYGPAKPRSQASSESEPEVLASVAPSLPASKRLRVKAWNLRKGDTLIPTLRVVEHVHRPGLPSEKVTISFEGGKSASFNKKTRITVERPI